MWDWQAPGTRGLVTRRTARQYTLLRPFQYSVAVLQWH